MLVGMTSMTVTRRSNAHLRQIQLEHWQRLRQRRFENRPLSDAEALAFRQIRGWLDCGASLSVAIANSDIAEPQLAAWVQEMLNGRNGQFAQSLTELLRVPWHFEGGGYDAHPEYYSPGAGPDLMTATMVRWCD